MNMDVVLKVISVLAKAFQKLEFNLEYLGDGKVKISVIVDVDGDTNVS